MKNWKRLSPGLFGLLIYTSIRLITDTASGFNVLLYRDQWTNAFEIVSSILIGYILHQVILRFEQYQSKEAVTLRNVLKEFGLLTLVSILSLNATVGVVTMISDDGMDKHDFVVINLIPLLFILIIYSIRRGNSLLQSYVAQQTELERIKRDKSETELNFLKSQYHPHFLFNALNTIYFQMDDSIAQAKNTIEKLSDLLRYQLYEGQNQLIEAEKELDFIQKYVNLQRERLPDTVQIVFDKENITGKIFPLLTMPTVENAFKYVSGDKKHIQIYASTTDGSFKFQVKNSCLPLSYNPKYSGIGLSNLQRRLDLLYPSNYTFETRMDQNEFTATLILPIK